MPEESIDEPKPVRSSNGHTRDNAQVFFVPELINDDDAQPGCQTRSQRHSFTRSQCHESTSLLERSPQSISLSLSTQFDTRHSFVLPSVPGSHSASFVHSEDTEGEKSTSPSINTDIAQVSIRVAELERTSSQILERMEKLEKIISERISVDSGPLQPLRSTSSLDRIIWAPQVCLSQTALPSKLACGQSEHILDRFDDGQAGSRLAITGAYSESSREVSNIAVEHSSIPKHPRQQGEFYNESAGYSRSYDMGLGSASDSTGAYCDSFSETEFNTGMDPSQHTQSSGVLVSSFASAIQASSTRVSSHGGVADSDDILLVVQSSIASSGTIASAGTITSSANGPADSHLMLSGRDVSVKMEQESSTENHVPSINVSDETSVSGSSVIALDEVRSQTVYGTSSSILGPSNIQTTKTNLKHSSRASSSSSSTMVLTIPQSQSVDLSASGISPRSNLLSNVLNESDVDSDDNVRPLLSKFDDW